jgi:hypothetical protein
MYFEKKMFGIISSNHAKQFKTKKIADALLNQIPISPDLSDSRRSEAAGPKRAPALNGIAVAVVHEDTTDFCSSTFIQNIGA